MIVFANRSTKSLTWHARLMGREAKRLLAMPGFSGRVLAVFSNTIYLSGRDGEILWVLREGMPMHRRCLLASLPSSSICRGQNFFVENSCLRIGKGVTIDLSHSAQWEPPAIGPEKAVPLVRVNASYQRMLAAISILNNSGGLGQAISLLSTNADGRPMAILPANFLASRARSAILGLARACFDQDIARITQRGRDLVGLGPGLTPSGDDFLGGLLFAAHCLKRAYPLDFCWEPKAVMPLIDWARTKTNSISHAFLSDLALGQGLEPMHELVNSLLESRDLGCLQPSTNQLLGIGHTSGGDMLAGTLTGMLLVVGKLKAQHRA